MRTILLSAISAMLLSCNTKSESVTGFSITPKTGNGKIKTKQFDMSFDEIKVVQSLHAEVIKADTEKIVISAPSDILNDVLVENDNGELLVRLTPGIRLSTKDIKVKIYAKDFSKIEATSSAKIEVKNKFTQDATEVEVSSSGQITGDLEANDLKIDASSSGHFSGNIWAVNLDADASSSGTIKISGKSKNAEFAASSSGNINAEEFIAQTAKVKASSSGSIKAGVSDLLDASANSSGEISVIRKGNLHVQSQNSNSGGRITVK